MDIYDWAAVALADEYLIRGFGLTVECRGMSGQLGGRNYFGSNKRFRQPYIKSFHFEHCGQERGRGVMLYGLCGAPCYNWIF